ncbi:IS630 family transposase [Streptomyces bobili]
MSAHQVYEAARGLGTCGEQLGSPLLLGLLFGTFRVTPLLQRALDVVCGHVASPSQSRLAAAGSCPGHARRSYGAGLTRRARLTTYARLLLGAYFSRQVNASRFGRHTRCRAELAAGAAGPARGQVHRMPIAESNSIRSGDSVAPLFRWFANPRPEPELPFLLVAADGELRGHRAGQSGPPRTPPSTTRALLCVIAPEEVQGETVVEAVLSRCDGADSVVVTTAAPGNLATLLDPFHAALHLGVRPRRLADAQRAVGDELARRSWPVVVVRDVHLLRTEALQYVYGLWSLFQERERRMPVVLVGPERIRSVLRQPSLASLESGSLPGMPERRTHDYVRNGLTTLFAAFDVATGEVIAALHRRHRAAEFKKFLIRIDKEVPAHLQIHLIVDNYGTHKTPAIKAWLAKHPRFELHFTPTGSSWINQVERWFGYLAHQMIRRGAHKNIQALEADIRAWVKDWNEDPKPFIWTKTAEEILDSLARFCRRISGAGH